MSTRCICVACIGDTSMTELFWMIWMKSLRRKVLSKTVSFKKLKNNSVVIMLDQFKIPFSKLHRIQEVQNCLIIDPPWWVSFQSMLLDIRRILWSHISQMNGRIRKPPMVSNTQYRTCLRGTTASQAETKCWRSSHTPELVNHRALVICVVNCSDNGCLQRGRKVSTSRTYMSVPQSLF